ncbi:CHASE2 domain-containing protein [Sphingomonas profundi]|uniref:CHASE2 domain-containing protein n=1 Tax=Alterirhizorhabdus profundi TaxID=2681549 RepID=UPI0012E93673|nr:CHASE2 domain-containing protein [Sphingomonas profundi]
MTGSNSTSEPAPEAAVAHGRPPLRVALAGLCAAVLVAAALLWIGQDATGRALFDRFQRLAPAPVHDPATRVVLIDPESLKIAGPWPWPRYLIARLTEEIAARGATAIGFDMLFPEPDRFNPDRVAALYPELSAETRAAMRAVRSQDQVFAEVIGRHPVVLARLGVAAGSMDAGSAERNAARLPVNAAFAGPLPARVLSFPAAITDIADLDEVAAGQAVVNGAPDRDGVVRRVPLVASVAGAPTPGFALELARIGLGAETIAPLLSHGTLRAIGVGDRRVPVDPDGRMRLRFGRWPEGTLVPAGLLLQTGFDRAAFRGKIVLVGLGAAGTADVITTPLDAETYGTFVQAQAVDAILSGGALARPWWAPLAEWSLAALLATAAALLGPRLRGPAIPLVPLLAAVALVGGSFALFRFAGLVVDPLRPIAVGGAAALAVAAMLFVEQAARQRRLRAALAEQRVAAARAAGELEAAREIQLGMLPPRAGLATLHPRVDLDARLEPARSVGGDFYDAIPLGPDRLCVLVGDVTGKGVPAALFMALSRALSKSVLLRARDGLADAVATIDAELARDNAQDMFVTMLVAVLHTDTGRLDLCNAGHENPLRVTAGGTVEPLPLEGGPPLCVVGGFPYPVETVQLAPGDGIVLVSDGLTEAQDGAGGFFGHDRALAILSRWHGDATARSATDDLAGAVRAFEGGGEPSDDLTVLALRWRGPAAA